jgi:hypothetical protein
VGKSYPPEFYSFIKNSRVRTVMERIAQETEEDYQKLIKLLKSFGVEILRPNIAESIDHYWENDRYAMPPMTPRDYSASIGNKFYFTITTDIPKRKWDAWRGSSWPKNPPKNGQQYTELPQFIKDEIAQMSGITNPRFRFGWENIIKHVEDQGNTVILDEHINSATTTRIGKDLYFGTENYTDDVSALKQKYSNMFPEYRCHIINTGGHSDGTFCPVVPGLIVSLKDIPTYTETFPGWEVMYLPGQSWSKVKPFLDLKEKNKGKWWVPGEELNDEFTDFVESWLNHWVGYVEETVFDVNMLVIDEKNVVCNNYNKSVFDAFDRHEITPHVINFRHRYFWDGGLHCVTSDLHREGTIKDYFPERG